MLKSIELATEFCVIYLEDVLTAVFKQTGWIFEVKCCDQLRSHFVMFAAET